MYIELIIILNYLFDFILLFSVNMVLKNNISLTRLSIGALSGILTIPFIFLRIPYYITIVIRLLYGLVMVIVTFKYKNIIYTIKNLLYLYMISTIIGGFLYYLSIEISYQVFLIVLVPFYLYLVYFMIKKEERIRSYSYNVKVAINNSEIALKGYLDTGNAVKDYLLNNKVIIVSNDVISKYLNNNIFYYLNIKTVSGEELLRCYKVNKVEINNKVINKCVVGVSSHFDHNTFDVLIPYYLEEDIC